MTNDSALAANPWVTKFAAVMGEARPWLAGVPSFSKVQDAFYTAIGQVERGDPVDSTLADASKQINSILGCQ